MNLMTSPPRPQPKHLNVRRSSFTLNDGVFSPWNGHKPFHATPALRSGKRSWTICTMLACDFSSSMKPAGKRGMSLVGAARRQQDRPGATADCSVVRLPLHAPDAPLFLQLHD